MNKIHVFVLGGGISNEREVSLNSARQVAKNLPADKYSVSLVEISKDGKWLLRGAPDKDGNPKLGSKSKPLAVYGQSGLTLGDLRSCDVAFIAMHGKFGEDGRLQSILDLLNIPYTGSGMLASAIGMNKQKTNELAAGRGVDCPEFFLVRSPFKKEGLIRIRSRIKKSFGFPCVVKPNESGSSVGVTIVRRKNDLESALKSAAKEDRNVLIQRFIKGRELTCGVLGNTGRGEPEALPTVEIIPAGREFFDYEAKYASRTTREICPAEISKALSRQIQKLSQKVHTALGCCGLTRSDFILDEAGKLYFLEINTIPGLTEASLCPKEAAALGWSFGEFLSKLISLAMEK